MTYVIMVKCHNECMNRTMGRYKASIVIGGEERQVPPNLPSVPVLIFESIERAATKFPENFWLVGQEGVSVRVNMKRYPGT